MCMKLNETQELDDFKEILLGKKLGRGAYRDVYECALNKEYVVKVENDNNGFSNAREWKLWEHVEYSPFEKFFAPCISISDTGLILIQKKVVQNDKLPETVAHFFTDVKPENFGWIGKNFVCCDYGSIGYQHVWSEKKTKKPHWKDFFTQNKIV